METLHYSTDKPVSDTNLFTLILKYSALFMIAWISGWLLLLVLFSREKNKGLENWVADNGGLTSIFIAVAVVLIFIVRAFKKYRYGIPFVFEFDNTQQQLSITVVNTLNDKERTIVIPYKQLGIYKQNIEDRLFGKQRIYRFCQNNKLVTKVNIDMTAWCRLKNLDEFLKQLNRRTWLTVKQYKQLE